MRKLEQATQERLVKDSGLNATFKAEANKTGNPNSSHRSIANPTSQTSARDELAGAKYLDVRG